MPLAIPLLILLAFLVASGTAMITRSIAGGWIKWFAQTALAASTLGLFVTDQAVKLSASITHQLGRAANAITAQTVHWFANLAEYVNVVGYWSLTWPVVIYHEVAKLLHHDIPVAVNARTKPLSRRLDNVEAQAKATAGLAHSFPHKIKAASHTPELTRIERVAMPHAGEWDWVHDHFDALKKAVAGTAAAVVGHALPHSVTWPTWEGLTAKNLRARLRRLEGLLGATGAALLVARAIGGVSANCVKKGGIGKAARALCGIPSHLLNDLLSVLADVWVLENVCVLLPLLESTASDIGTPLVEAMTGVTAGLCKGHTAPPPLQGPTAKVPALVFGVAASAV